MSHWTNVSLDNSLPWTEFPLGEYSPWVKVSLDKVSLDKSPLDNSPLDKCHLDNCGNTIWCTLWFLGAGKVMFQGTCGNVQCGPVTRGLIVAMGLVICILLADFSILLRGWNPQEEASWRKRKSGVEEKLSIPVLMLSWSPEWNWPIKSTNRNSER